MKNKNRPEHKPRLQPSKEHASHPSRHPQDEGEVQLNDKEKEEKRIAKTTSETTGTVDLLNPAFDPDIPENKQRWLR